MAEPVDAASYVYEGFWNNEIKPGPFALTYTVANGTLITNTLSLFIAMCGGQVWMILRFTVHQYYSSRSASGQQDGTNLAHNQQQSILRNTSSAFDTARLIVYSMWSNRHMPEKSKLFVVVVLAIIHTITFIAAAAFSNEWIDAGPAVLSRSPHCGTWNQTYLSIATGTSSVNSSDSSSVMTEYSAKVTHDVQLSQEYAQECYLELGSLSTCGIFNNSLRRARLNWTKKFDESCPFEFSLCSTNGYTLVMDTGMIDSFLHLGINARARDRIQYRRVTACSVINGTDYTSQWAKSGAGLQLSSSSDTAFASYGHSITENTNWTYSSTNIPTFEASVLTISSSQYQLNTQIAYSKYSPAQDSSFVPISKLKITDADVSLMFLTFLGTHKTPIDDPWYSSHKHFTEAASTTEASSSEAFYVIDQPISTLACSEKHQFCTSVGCTPLLGYHEVQQNFMASQRPTANQNVTLGRIMGAISTSKLSDVTSALSSAALTANNLTLVEGVDTSTLPDDQWVLEVTYWHSIALAQLQRNMLEYATGQIAAQLEYFVPPETQAEKWICQNLIIDSDIFQSYSIMTLALIFLCGSMVMSLGLYIETVVSWIQRRFDRGARGREMWEDHYLLGPQLWRLNVQKRDSKNKEENDAHDGKSEFDEHQDSPAVDRPPLRSYSGDERGDDNKSK